MAVFMWRVALLLFTTRQICTDDSSIRAENDSEKQKYACQPEPAVAI